MVEFEMIKDCKDLIVVIRYYITEIELLKNMIKDIENVVELKNKRLILDTKVAECNALLYELEQLDEEKKLTMFINEYKTFLESHVPICGMCKINDAEDKSTNCKLCNQIVSHTQDSDTCKKLYDLAVVNPEKFYETCGYLCFGCAQKIESDKVKFCANCKLLTYCSKQCQRNHWYRANNGHSKECKRMGKKFTSNCSKEELQTLRALNQAHLHTIYDFAMNHVKHS